MRFRQNYLLEAFVILMWFAIALSIYRFVENQYVEMFVLALVIVPIGMRFNSLLIIQIIGDKRIIIKKGNIKSEVILNDIDYILKVSLLPQKIKLGLFEDYFIYSNSKAYRINQFSLNEDKENLVDHLISQYEVPVKYRQSFFLIAPIEEK